MKLWYKLFPNDLKIIAFNRGWWFYIVITVLGTILFTLYGNTLTPDKKLTYIMITSIIEFIILRVYKLYMIHIRDDYRYFNELPCYLCNQSTILCIIAAATNNSHLMSFCIVMGTCGSLLALTFPDKIVYNQPFYSLQTLGFYAYHSLLIITSLSFLTLGLYKADISDIFWNMLMLYALGTFTHFVNVFLIRTNLYPEANYSFTIHPDNGFTQMLYNFCPKPFFYMLPCPLITGALTVLLLLFMRIFKK
ncbi:MAG: YwaF family protein [Erysipelotrichaceae bacterium]|nr:YwaF family protein [Erysipelotrichaceae bacterium]